MLNVFVGTGFVKPEPGLVISLSFVGLTVALPNVPVFVAVFATWGRKSKLSFKLNIPNLSDLYTGISSVLIVPAAGLEVSSIG